MLSLIVVTFWALCGLIVSENEFEFIGRFYTRSRILEIREQVSRAFDHAFDNYMKFAYPLDELEPIQCRGIGLGDGLVKRIAPCDQHQQKFKHLSRPRCMARSRASEVHKDEASRDRVSSTKHIVTVDQIEGDPGGQYEILGGFLLTLIDSLDTIALMHRKSQFKDAVLALTSKVKNFAIDNRILVFEVIIRVLGGLLSAHLIAIDEERWNMESTDWYDDELLHLAVELGDRLLPAFQSSGTGLPCNRLNLKTGQAFCNKFPVIDIASAGTCLLEFGVLSQLTNDPKYLKAAVKSTLTVWSKRSALNLLPSALNSKTGKAARMLSGIGASDDSFHEYLMKGSSYFANEGKAALSRTLAKAFNLSYDAIMRYIKNDAGTAYLPVNYLTGMTNMSVVDSLAAFFPGLQAQVGDVSHALRHYCYYLTQFLWHNGLYPERQNIKTKAIIGREYYLRPEFIESTYHLYLATHRNPLFLKIGEFFLVSLNKHCKTECGYRTIKDILEPRNPGKQDNPRMESFFLSETLKYLYLLFDPDSILRCNEHLAINVEFSTEAHPLYSMKPRGAHWSEKAVVVSRSQCCQYFEQNFTSLTAKHLQRSTKTLDTIYFPFFDCADLLGIRDELLACIRDPESIQDNQGRKILVELIAQYSPTFCITLQASKAKPARTIPKSILKDSNPPLSFSPPVRQ